MPDLKSWILASRPKTLWAGIAPVIMGTAMAAAEGKFHAPAALAALLGAVFIQIGTNFANDYFDYRKGADTGQRLGPTRATQAGLVPPHAMQAAYIFTFALAMLAGLYLVWRAGWPIVAIGTVSILLGILYTATPFALAYTGLADIFVLIFFGPVAVAGTYFVQALTFSSTAVTIGFAPGLFSVALLTVNNLRDIEEDRQTGKNTLAVRFGPGYMKFQYIACLVLACALPAMLYLRTQQHAPAALVLALLLLAIPAIRIMIRPGAGAILNSVLARTGQLLLLYSLLFSLGWLL